MCIISISVFVFLCLHAVDDMSLPPILCGVRRIEVEFVINVLFGADRAGPGKLYGPRGREANHSGFSRAPVPLNDKQL